MVILINPNKWTMLLPAHDPDSKNPHGSSELRVIKQACTTAAGMITSGIYYLQFNNHYYKVYRDGNWITKQRIRGNKKIKEMFNGINIQVNIQGSVSGRNKGKSKS